MRSFTACIAAAGLALSLGVSGPAGGAETTDPRDLAVEEVRNDAPAFMVRVDVDKPDRIYTAGDEMRVRVVSARDGYLYLLYCDAGGNVSCLFPNAFGQDNRISAMRPVVVPPPPGPGGSTFRLRIGPPYGREVLKAIVSLEPMEAGALGRLMSAEPARARLAGVRGVFVEEVKPADWAEHHVEIITRDVIGGGPSRRPAADSGTAAAGSPRRVGVFIGISRFADERIRDLSVCARDASAMAEVMRRRCRIGQGWVLLDEEATRRNIEHVLRRQVPAATRPGDSVILYWSGHGSRCADDGGDERDGFDEYLVPHDGCLDDLRTIRSTMILDDTFGRWIQELDGRRVVVVLDTCHSGGQTAREKSLPGGLSGGPTPAEGAAFDFLDGEFARIKDIGQRDTAVLASSTARQVSFERKEGDLSAMTHFLVAQLEEPGGPVTLSDAFARLRERVARYVEQRFPGATQTPVLTSDLAGPFYLRP
jgi:hypothetical protein